MSHTKNPYYVAVREFEKKLVAKKVRLPRNRLLRLGIITSLFKKHDPARYKKAKKEEEKWLKEREKKD